MTAGLLLAVSGCSLAPSWFPGGDPSVEHLSDGTAFLVAERGDGVQMTALVRGALTVIGGGCLGFDPSDGSGTVVLVLPHGSHPAGDGSAVTIAGGPTVHVGDAVMGGGRDLTGEEDVVASVWPPRQIAAPAPPLRRLAVTGAASCGSGSGGRMPPSGVGPPT